MFEAQRDIAAASQANQAKVSAELMALEQQCAEPRNPLRLHGTDGSGRVDSFGAKTSVPDSYNGNMVPDLV